MKVLSIDAWGNPEDGFAWNNWFHIGDVDDSTTNENVVSVLIEKGILTELARTEAVVDDDGYNYVIQDKTGLPLFAVEHGAIDYTIPTRVRIQNYSCSGIG